jgi:chaperonin GroEL
MGRTVCTADLGIKLENVTINMLGRTKKVMIDKENTTIVGGAGKKADIQARIYPDQGADRGNDLRLRPGDAARGTFQARRRVAVLRVGGATEIEVKEHKDRVDNAMHATRAAIPRGTKKKERDFLAIWDRAE